MLFIASLIGLEFTLVCEFVCENNWADDCCYDSNHYAIKHCFFFVDFEDV